MKEIRKIDKFKIAGLELDNNIFMAPLAGITDTAFRIIANELGVGLSFTEMVSAKGLYHKDKKTNILTFIDDREKNTGIQIFGSDPDIMREVVINHINNREDIKVIDINMGCPAPKIVKNGEGSALMKDLKQAEKVLKSVVDASTKPVSVKFRLGWDEDSINYIDLGKVAESVGVDFVTLHPRTRKAFYSGDADWEAIKKLKENISIPVIGNGDIHKYSDIQKMMDFTGCDGVSIGRGALNNPYIFCGNDNPDIDDIINLIKKHYKFKIEFLGENIAIKEMRKHVAWYLKGYRNSNKLKNKINTLDNLDEIFYCIDEFLINYKENNLKGGEEN